MLRRKGLAAVLVPAAALVLSGCGQSGQSTGTSGTSTAQTSATQPGLSAAHNEADVIFATDMIPHHAQAIEMADLALARATSAQVRDLATRIKAAQDPEIRTMSAWLVAWGGSVPSTGAHHDMGSMGSTEGQSGMMSTQEMADLGDATGVAFDRMWLQMMIRHHQGAVAMARTELSAGSNPEAKALAQAIIDGQTKEISEMESLLGTLKG